MTTVQDPAYAREFLANFGTSAMQVAIEQKGPKLGLVGTIIFTWTAIDTGNNDPAYIESMNKLLREVDSFLGEVVCPFPKAYAPSD